MLSTVLIIWFSVFGFFTLTFFCLVIDYIYNNNVEKIYNPLNIKKHLNKYFLTLYNGK